MFWIVSFKHYLIHILIVDFLIGSDACSLKQITVTLAHFNIWFTSFFWEEIQTIAKIRDLIHNNFFSHIKFPTSEAETVSGLLRHSVKLHCGIYNREQSYGQEGSDVIMWNKGNKTGSHLECEHRTKNLWRTQEGQNLFVKVWQCLDVSRHVCGG